MQTYEVTFIWDHATIETTLIEAASGKEAVAKARRMLGRKATRISAQLAPTVEA